MGLIAIYTDSVLLSHLEILNVKETLVMAERRQEARLVFRITMKIIKEEVKPHFFIVLPFELRNGRRGLISKRQDSLLDYDRNVSTDLCMYFGSDKYRFVDVEKETRNLILRTENESLSVHIPEDEDFYISEAVFMEFEGSMENVLSNHSLLHIEFAGPLPKGLYSIKFYCYIGDFLRKVADYGMFEERRILETSVLDNTAIKERIIPSGCSELVFDYLEFFILTPSNVVVSDISPEGFESDIFTEEEEAELGGVVDMIDPAEFDYKPYRGRHQFKWVYCSDSKKKYVSLTYWPPSATPVLILLVTLLLNFLGLLFLISAAEKLLAVSVFSFLCILGVFDLFVYSSTIKPKIIQKFFFFIRISGIKRTLNQISGSVFFFIVISVSIYAFGEHLALEVPVIWSLLTFIGVFLTLTVDVYPRVIKNMKEFFKTLAYRNAVDLAVSLILTVLVLNIYFFRVSPIWAWENTLSFFVVVLSFHVLTGKAFEYVVPA